MTWIVTKKWISRKWTKKVKAKNYHAEDREFKFYNIIIKLESSL